jgi:hypothetical protein
MPGLDYGRFVIYDNTADLSELTWTELMIPRELDGRQPELGVLSIPSNVNVHGLVAVEAVEKEPERPWNTRDPRHLARLHAR